MPSVRYKGHYISVVHLPDRSGKASCIPSVDIRYNRDRMLSARLMPEESFGSAEDATEYGFAVGKQWVDRQLEPKGSALEPSPGISAFLGLRLRLWTASLFSRGQSA